MAHSETGDTKTTITLTIDGKQVTVPAGSTILTAAAELGIKIPTLCWLKKVSTTGACRICVVKVEGVERFMTACNTPVKEGITVISTSPELESARKKTLELMLVNHPLDCPVCDAGGECNLQDTCYGLKVDKNSYGANLERLPIRYDWKLLESDPNRCILCEKCVKVCREIVGREAIETVDRGDNAIIDTVTRQPLDCDFCGNCVGACPTGTLISKPFKFKGRPWTFDVKPSICAFCSSGCQIDYHAKDGRIERVTSSDDGFNKGNLCINGRFGYAAFNSTERLTSPLIKSGSGELHKTSWDQALGVAAAAFKKAAATGESTIAGIASPRVTNEESYLFQKFLRGALGSNNIDSEARLGYLPAQEIQWKALGYSGGTFSMDTIEHATAIIVIGADLKAESAGFAYRVIQAVTKNDATLVLAGSRVTSMNKFANSFLQCRPGSEAWLVAGLNKALLACCGAANAASVTGMDALIASLDALSFADISKNSGISEALFHEAAALMCSGGRTAVIYGAEVIRSADSKNAVAGAVNMALLTGATTEAGAGIYPLDEKNNIQGMLDMGCCPEYLPGYHTYEHAAAAFSSAWNATVPTTPGKDLFQIIDAIEAGQIKALYVMGSDPLHFMPDRTRVLKALQKLELLVVQDLFLTDTARLAHIVFPAATGAEKSGSFTSIDNRVQCFDAAVKLAGESRTDADILMQLYQLVAPVKALVPQSAIDLQHEITALSGLYSETCNHEGCRMGRIKSRTATSVALPLAPQIPALPTRTFMLTVGPILHHNGSMTTRSENNMLVAGEEFAAVNGQDASRLGIASGELLTITADCGSVTLKVRVSDDQQIGSLFVPAHFCAAHINEIYHSSSFPIPVTLTKA